MDRLSVLLCCCVILQQQLKRRLSVVFHLSDFSFRVLNVGLMKTLSKLLRTVKATQELRKECKHWTSIGT